MSYKAIGVHYLILLFWGFASGCYQTPKPEISAQPPAVASPDRSDGLGRTPEVLVDGAELTLIAREPDIVTPTGIAVDEADRIWVIENHTHLRQDNYPGP
ncbi:uncharacterized protein METZ01_LOCUS493886, partial [marine metagenome]